MNVGANEILVTSLVKTKVEMKETIKNSLPCYHKARFLILLYWNHPRVMKKFHYQRKVIEKDWKCIRKKIPLSFKSKNNVVHDKTGKPEHDNETKREQDSHPLQAAVQKLCQSITNIHAQICSNIKLIKLEKITEHVLDHSTYFLCLSFSYLKFSYSSLN